MTGAKLAAAIELAALGRYVPALELIDALDDELSEGLALRASILRQLADHAAAQGADLEAVRLDPQCWDARIGLVADAVGLGALELARRRLDELPTVLPEARLAVRRAWVAAECSLAQGDPTAALRHGHEAAHLAGAVSPRHLAKSRALLGACQAASGDLTGARSSLRAAAAGAGAWRSILWPTAAVMAGLAAEPEAGRWRAWAQALVAGIAVGLTPALLAGWRRDPAAASLLDRR